MQLEDTLVQCGFEEKEAKVYVAVLELGMEKVQEIAKRAGVKRSTTYLILEHLYAKNYIGKTIQHKKIYYTAEKPEMVLQSFGRREELFQKLMPFLKTRMGGKETRPKIKLYEGKEGVEKLYDEIYQSASVSFFGSINEVDQELKGLREKIKQIIKSQDITVRDLITHDPKDIDFAIAAQGHKYEARVIPKHLDLVSDGAIYGHKLAIISVRGDAFAVVIESKDIAHTFRSFYELAWASAQPLEELRNKK